MRPKKLTVGQFIKRGGRKIGGDLDAESRALEQRDYGQGGKGTGRACQGIESKRTDIK